MRLVIACGGSGGHIYPGLTLAKTLQQLQPKVNVAFLAARKATDQAIFAKRPYRVHALIPCPMPEHGSFIRWFFFLMRFMAAFCQALWIQLTFRPRCMVAFGGYVSGPAILSALLFRRKTLLHEENLVPGRANRLLTSHVTRICLGWRESARFLRPSHPPVTTGLVVRSDLKRLDRKTALAFFRLDTARKTILVMGGSQGSHRVNALFLDSLKELPREALDGLQVIHLSGAHDAPWLSAGYQAFQFPVKVTPFLEAMSEAYSAADIVVGRGGAMTIAEVIYFRKPSVLIPLRLAGGHQRQNIKLLSEQEACYLLTEEAATPILFAKILQGLLEDAALRQTLSQNLCYFEIDVAAKRLAGEVLKLLNGVNMEGQKTIDNRLETIDMKGKQNILELSTLRLKCL